jgi:hypothetical protein
VGSPAGALVSAGPLGPAAGADLRVPGAWPCLAALAAAIRSARSFAAACRARTATRRLTRDKALQALAPEFHGAVPDSRRFRVTITISGADAWAEHGWHGQRVTIGEVTDARILHALARLRGKNDITFGIWCEILRPGRVCVGDAVTPRPRGV